MMASRTKENVLTEVESYQLTDSKCKLIVSFINKICLSAIPPIPMVGNSCGDFGPMEENNPGVYWDDEINYVDVEINEDGSTFSLYGRDREGGKENVNHSNGEENTACQNSLCRRAINTSTG